MIWFVDNARPSNGDGRLSAPFNCLVGPGCFNPAAADDPGDNIFLFSGSTSYNGGLTLLNNQRLIGQGATATLASITALTVPAGSAIAGTAFGTLTVADASITGTGQALDLTTGTLTADDNSRSRLLIQDNSVSGQRQGAMFFNASNTAQLDVTLTGNTLSTQPANPAAFENLTVGANSSGAEASNVCTNIRNNSVARGGADAFGAGVPADAIFLNNDAGSTLRLERGTSASNDPAQVVRDNNPASAANGVFTDGTITLVATGTCLLPETAPLP